MEVKKANEEQRGNAIDEKSLYCTYCGKQIAEDDIYCPHCGKQQGNTTKQGMANKRHIELTNSLASSKICKQGEKTDTRNRIMHWAKRTVLAILVVCGIGIFALFSLWMYGCYKIWQWEKDDQNMVELATKDISKSDSIARELFEIQRERTHYYGFSSSYCNSNHIKMGLDLIRNAAEKGDKDSQFTLGAIYAGAHYEYSQPCFDKESKTMFHEDIDYERAAYWYSLSAKQGHETALNNLGICYREGNGVSKDLVKATKYIVKSAELGYDLAQNNMGNMYEKGEVYETIEDSVTGKTIYKNVGPDLVKARKWWEKAARQGNNEAKKKIEKVYE